MCRLVHKAWLVDTWAGMCLYMCVDMCTGQWLVDTCTGMCVYMCAEIKQKKIRAHKKHRKNMCTETCADMCADVCRLDVSELYDAITT